MNSNWTPNFKKPPLHKDDVLPKGVIETEIFVILREDTDEFLTDISSEGDVTWSKDPNDILKYTSLHHAASDAKRLNLNEGRIAVCEVHLDPEGNAPSEKFIGGVGFRPFFRFSYEKDSH